MKTLKQISTEYGVSKQAMYKRIRGSLADSMRDHIQIQDKIMYVTPEGEKILKDVFKCVSRETHTDKHTDIRDAYIKTLLEQLSVKDAEIDRLHGIIEENQKTLQAQQYLGAPKRIQRLLERLKIKKIE